MIRDLQTELVRLYPTSCGSPGGRLFHVTDPQVLWARDPGCLVSVDVVKPDMVRVSVTGRVPRSTELDRLIAAHGEAWAQGGHHGGVSILIPGHAFERVNQLADLLESERVRQPRKCSSGLPKAIDALRELAQRLREISALD